MLFAAPTISAHTFYTTLTRLDYNAKEKTLEITVEVFTHDVDQILKVSEKKAEKSATEDEKIFAYLKKNFIVRDAAENALSLEWIGTESKVDTTYFYVRISNVESFENFSLQNTIFFESYPEQKNLVVARWSDKKADLMFKPGDKFQMIAVKNSETAAAK